MPDVLRLRGASEHNLQSVDLDLELGGWIAFTGPSGSGKTTLVFDTIVREGQARYLGAMSARARQFFGKLGRARVELIEGLPPPITIGEDSGASSARSTVGTRTGALDLLRLLFARTAADPGGTPLTRSHFSFNHPLGACEACQGLGVEDRVDPTRLVADPSKSLRDGALRPTLKNGYTVYSQVTLEVMDQICRAHGFDVNTPWAELSQEQRDVILFGTKALKVPFGKHPIESRMKWEGITARPREEGYYRGLVSVIAETLERNRNPNVLRFVRSAPCTSCGGTRLARAGREACVGETTLPELLAVPASELSRPFLQLARDLPGSPVWSAIRPSLEARLERMIRLGLGHLSLDRTSPTLSDGEAQRMRLAAQLTAGLGGTVIALDEPTRGLHPEGQAGMTAVLDEVRELGNTLLVVEHDPDLVRQADRMVSLGPGAGPDGGRIVSCGPLPEHPLGPPPRPPTRARAATGALHLRGATLHNLRGVDLTVHLGTLQVVLGPSGAGKSSLVFGTLLPALLGEDGGPFTALEGAPPGGVAALDARPIGRTPRSTPATWTGLFDLVRKRFAATGGGRGRGFGAGRFSYNNREGQCATCKGLGFERVGLHLLEDLELPCSACAGARYAPETLEVELRGRNIGDVLGMSVTEALEYFAEDAAALRYVDALERLGLGYLPLGTPSNRLSSGEGQRVKLASLLGAEDPQPTLLLLDEPDRGLHPSDVDRLLVAFDALLEAGHSVLAISHHRHLWAAADHRVELRDGTLNASPKIDWGVLTPNRAPRPASTIPKEIHLAGVRTHQLADIDVRIPHRAITAIAGVSGSGKSSLAFDTLAAEALHRFAESLPFQVRRFLRRMPRPTLESASGLGPTLALRPGPGHGGPRSTVATQTELGPLLRLMWSRAGTRDGEPCGSSAEHFSPDRALGACETCAGLANVQRCDPERLVSDATLPLAGGALAGTRAGRFFSEADGQHMATLRCAAPDVDWSVAWSALPESARTLALEGAGDTVFAVEWTFAEGKREGGPHAFESTWDGLLRLVEREAQRRAASKRAAEWAAPLVPAPCPACAGSGLAPSVRAVLVGELALHDVLRARVDELESLLTSNHLSPMQRAVVDALLPEVQARLGDLDAVGLGHLTLDRRTRTLSAGELQRVRLASVLRSGLAGVTLVLDEPSAGLHARDIRTLTDRIAQFRDAGNTVVVVEHEPRLLRSADHLIELGPGAGPDGGRVTGAGPPATVLAGEGVTARALRRAPPRPAPARHAERLSIRGACAHNLAGIDIELPAAGFVAVTGPSGSGKSSLVFDVLGASMRAGRPVACASIDGIGRFVESRTARSLEARSSPLSALALMPALQRLFHGEGAGAGPGAGLTRQAFSFKSPAGRCVTCRGSGRERVSLDFLADLDLACPACAGSRYRPEVLAVRWKGRSVAEFLDEPIATLLPDLPAGKLSAGAEALERVGLGALAFGRRPEDMSLGELQRLTLAASLLQAPSPALYLFDEPATGLHEADLVQLCAVVDELAARGDLIVAAEHRLSLIAAADWVVDLGPGGGPDGGLLVDCGPPSELRHGATAEALRE
ncbi:MAG: AAA family ATPase [bacterium]|nr:AAA family ATPase [bacterium]